MRWLLLLLVAGCAQITPYDCTTDPDVLRHTGTPRHETALRACNVYHSVMEEEAARRRVYMGAAILFGAASDALWVNNIQRDPLGTVAPYRRLRSQ